MKHLRLFTPNRFFLVCIFCFCTGILGYSQCVIEAGNDTAVCVANGQYKIQLNARVLAGSPPYQLAWKYRDSLSPRLVWNASDMLDDTTSPNPTILEYPLDAKPLELVAEMTDGKNYTCLDTVTVFFSRYIRTQDDKYAYIKAGDSTTLFTSVGGGLPPLSYRWNPPGSLDDPTVLHANASPVVTTTYLLTITDSIGCQTDDIFYVVVSTSGLSTLEEASQLDIFPNPIAPNQRLNLIWEGSKTGELTIMNADGKVISKQTVYPGSKEVHLGSVSPGVYFYRMTSENSVMARGRLVKL